MRSIRSDKPRLVSIFGSTGSIGTQTLSVLSDLAKNSSDAGEEERFVVHSLIARSSVDLLVQQAVTYRPKVVGVTDRGRVDELKRRLYDLGLSGQIEVAAGEDLYALAGESDVVMNAVTGFAGLRVTQATLLSGKRLAIANKESVVAAGDLVESWTSSGKGEIIPVDSEHSAIFQVLGETRQPRPSLNRLILTASGGPFRKLSFEELERVTLADALSHPTWQMGPKNTIDSSTLANKGLEVIEAHYLFSIPYDQISVVVHPQSVVHSMIEFSDASVLAQMSLPDMRLPISLALLAPDRSSTPYGAISFENGFSLEFESPDLRKFRALAIAYEAGRLGGAGPCWFNAANEVAVDHFINGSIAWRDIAVLLELAMEGCPSGMISSIEDVISIDEQSRAYASRVCKEKF